MTEPTKFTDTYMQMVNLISRMEEIKDMVEDGELSEDEGAAAIREGEKKLREIRQKAAR
jgi:hypothetical protein